MKFLKIAGNWAIYLFLKILENFDSSKIKEKDRLPKTWRIDELLSGNENEANTNNIQYNVARERNVMNLDDDFESFIQSSSQTNEDMSININSTQRFI